MNPAGILEDAEAHPEGLVGVRERGPPEKGPGTGLGPSQKKREFFASNAVFWSAAFLFHVIYVRVFNMVVYSVCFCSDVKSFAFQPFSSLSKIALFAFPIVFLFLRACAKISNNTAQVAYDFKLVKCLFQ